MNEKVIDFMERKEEKVRSSKKSTKLPFDPALLIECIDSFEEAGFIFNFLKTANRNIPEDWRK